MAVTGVAHARFGTDAKNYNYLRMWGTPVPGGPFDVDDLAAALIRFENGASLLMQVSWAANTPQGEELRVMGTKGGLVIGSEGLRVITEDNGFNADISPMFNDQNVRVAQLDHFMAGIRDPEMKLRIDGRQGVVLQHMLDAIYASSESGREEVITVDV
jgi:predicted dehydrogenase